MRRLATTSTFLILFASFGFADFTPEQRKVNLDSFDHVWNTVREQHWDQSVPGLDWNAVRAELRPKVEKAQTDTEVRGILSDMLSRLHLTHFGIIPNSVYKDVAIAPKNAATKDPSTGETIAVPPSEDGTAGIDIRVLNEKAVVVSVEPGSSAAKQGVKPGWVILRIDGDDVAAPIERVSAAYASSTEKQLFLARTILSRLEGPLANPVEIEFHDGRDKSVTLTIERRPFRGEPAHFGYLPEEHMWIESRRIPPDVPYIGFNLFLDPPKLIPAFQQAVRSCMDCPGIVIDLRGNPGGIALIASGLAGFFVETPDTKLGTLYMRDLPLKFTINPRPPVYQGRVAILIDGLSASTSEILAGGLRDIHRARIFGSRSAGAALPSLIERLPNGDGFQYATASYQSESGKVLEGAGVTPDDPSPLTRAALLAGHDPALDAAIHWIHQSDANSSVRTKGNATP